MKHTLYHCSSLSNGANNRDLRCILYPSTLKWWVQNNSCNPEVTQIKPTLCVQLLCQAVEWATRLHEEEQKQEKEKEKEEHKQQNEKEKEEQKQQNEKEEQKQCGDSPNKAKGWNVMGDAASKQVQSAFKRTQQRQDQELHSQEHDARSSTPAQKNCRHPEQAGAIEVSGQKNCQHPEQAGAIEVSGQ